MRFFHRLCIAVIVLGWGAAFFAGQALAQDYEMMIKREQAKLRNLEKSQLTYQYMYERWLLRAQRHFDTRSGAFPFHTLLNAYSRGPDYDPLAQTTIDQLYRYAYTVENSNDPDEAEEAFVAFKQLLDRHMANLDVLSAAISLLEQNPLLGSPQFLIWMERGLLKRVLDSGDGLSIQSAYDIFSIGEEAAIFRHRRLKLMTTEALSDGRTYYHMHMAENPQTGQVERIYTRMTRVMQKLHERERLRNPNYRYDLPMPPDPEDGAAQEFPEELRIIKGLQ